MTDFRINKLIAERIGLSRRAADELIEKGRVTINGSTAILGAHVSANDTIMIDGKPLPADTTYVYLVLHKPVGYLSSRRSQGDIPTLYDLLPEQYHTLKTVGRLDKDSSGLILLTNDGDFTHQMTHPKFAKRKLYEVTLDQPLQPLHRQMISEFGVMLEDGKSQFGIERMNDGDDTRWQVTLHEGRNRQIRRTFGALGYIVTKLHRTTFGSYQIYQLVAGDWQTVEKK